VLFNPYTGEPRDVRDVQSDPQGILIVPIGHVEMLAAPKQAEPAWQPIESAPKDELILVGPTKRMGICAAMNHSRDGWVTETCGEWSSIYTPTHWMPLPSPPEAA
jgi:hypothetical protein